MPTIQLELEPTLQRRLQAKARKARMSVQKYILHVLDNDTEAAPRTGPELVKYWERMGVLGSRADIKDAQVEARRVREMASRRDRR